MLEKLNDPEFGDMLVMYVCVFAAGFLLGMTVFG
jgi:hypothetical protein